MFGVNVTPSGGDAKTMKTNNNKLTYADDKTGTVFASKIDDSIPCGKCPFADNMSCYKCSFS